MPQLFGALAEAIPSDEWPGLTFLDPFLSGGSVSLYAKARGFRVGCNDVALRSVLVGEALIANGSVRLSRSDIDRLFLQPGGPCPGVAERDFAPHVFSAPHARFIDRALYWAASPGIPPAKRALLLLLLIKWILRCQPMSLLSGTDAAAAATGDYDRLSSARLRHYVHSRRLLAPETVWTLAQPINAAVFPGDGWVEQGDAIRFLQRATGDAVYLDPPYPGTTGYETEYASLDRLLADTAHARSAYSSTRPPLDDLFAAAGRIPVWVVSLNNAVFGLDQLVGLIRRYRAEVEAIPIAYPHLQSLAAGAKTARNREFIIVARA